MTSKNNDADTTFIPYRTVLPEGFVCPSPGPVPDSMRENPIVARCGYLLQDHFGAWDRHDLYIGSGGFVFCAPHCLNIRVAPDLFMAFGVKAAVFPTDGYAVWDDKPPDLALEVASEYKCDDDINKKPCLYARIGIGEYWRFDPTGGELYGYPLAGDVLVNGVYQPIPINTDADGVCWGYSPTLDLSLCACFALWGGRLRFFDHKTGSYLRNLRESEAAHEEIQAALQESEAENELLRVEIRLLQGQ